MFVNKISVDNKWDLVCSYDYKINEINLGLVRLCPDAEHSMNLPGVLRHWIDLMYTYIIYQVNIYRGNNYTYVGYMNMFSYDTNRHIANKLHPNSKQLGGSSLTLTSYSPGDCGSTARLVSQWIDLLQLAIIKYEKFKHCCEMVQLSIQWGGKIIDNRLQTFAKKTVVFAL